MIRPSIGFMNMQSMYLVENAELMFIYVGGQVHPKACQQLFGALITEIDVLARQLPVLDNDLSVRVRALVSHIQ